jgi:DNA-binding PadR family transcriptional regulator
MEHLTDKEKVVLASFTENQFYENGLDSVLWLDSYIDTACLKSGLSEQAVGGVLSSLQKKGFIFVSTYDEHPRDNCVHLEEAGKTHIQDHNNQKEKHIMSKIKTITAAAEAVAAIAKVEVTETLCSYIDTYRKSQYSKDPMSFKDFCTYTDINRRKLTKTKLDDIVLELEQHISSQPNRKEFARKWRAFVVNSIHKAKYTRKQIIDMAIDKYEGRLSETAVATFLSDVKNPKYYQAVCKSPKLAIVTDGKVMAFQG